MKQQLTPLQFFTEAFEYLKQTYGLHPNDIDLTIEQSAELIAEGTTPQEHIERHAKKWNWTKAKDMTLKQATSIVNRFTDRIK